MQSAPGWQLHAFDDSGGIIYRIVYTGDQHRRRSLLMDTQGNFIRDASSIRIRQNRRPATADSEDLTTHGVGWLRAKTGLRIGLLEDKWRERRSSATIDPKAILPTRCCTFRPVAISFQNR
jgi:hypothetical protein